MGCTQSTSTRTQQQPAPSEIIQSSSEQPRAYRSVSSSASSLSAVPVGSRPGNIRLAAPKAWSSSSRTWTPQSLASERAAFFDTRVSGNAQTWAAVALAVSMARDDSDLDGAQTILEAAGCVVPTGYLADGIWDETGVLYKVPRWVVSDPLNMALDHSERDDIAAASDIRHDNTSTIDDQIHSAAAQSRMVTSGDSRQDPSEAKARQGKGKATATALEATNTKTQRSNLRLRLSDRDSDLILLLDTEITPVKDIIEMARTAAKVAQGIRINLAFMGKILKGDHPLEDQGWKKGCVVNCLIFASTSD